MAAKKSVPSAPVSGFNKLAIDGVDVKGKRVLMRYKFLTISLKLIRNNFVFGELFEFSVFHFRFFGTFCKVSEIMRRKSLYLWNSPDEFDMESLGYYLLDFKVVFFCRFQSWLQCANEGWKSNQQPKVMSSEFSSPYHLFKYIFGFVNALFVAIFSLLSRQCKNRHKLLLIL